MNIFSQATPVEQKAWSMSQHHYKYKDGMWRPLVWNWALGATVYANLGSQFFMFRLPQLQDGFDDVYFEKDF